MKKRLFYPILSISLLISLYFVALYQNPINWYMREKKAHLLFNVLTQKQEQKKILIDRVFFISLTENPERSSHIQELQQHFQKIPTEIFPAINGKYLSVQDIQQLETNNVLIPKASKFLSPGEIGCALSHRAIWQKVADDPTLENALILEDDAVIEETFENKWQEEVSGVVANYDVTFLYHYPHVTHLVPSRCEKNYVPLFPTCTHGYLLSKKGAKKLLSQVFPISKPIDNSLSEVYREKISLYHLFRLYRYPHKSEELLHVYVLKPDLVSTKGFSSTIQRKSISFNGHLIR